VGRRSAVVRLVPAVALVAALAAIPSSASAGPSDPVVPVAIDVAGAAGIAQSQMTFDAVVQDFNRDTYPDFLIGHHGTAAMQLFVNDGDGTFTEPDPNMFNRPDRHDCAAADVDLDGRLDIACAVGADHGVGIKRDQLWMQNPGPHLGFTEEGVAAGLVDPFARGRAPLFLDANGDGLPDLFMLNEPTRPDAFPSTNRFLLNQGGGVLDKAPSFGLDSNIPTRSLGTGCVQAADINGDGYPDVMVCGQDHVHVFLDEGGTHFADATAQLGVLGDSPVDATLQDVNGDGLLDLLEVTRSAFLVRLQRNGVFHPPSFSYALTSGTALGVGDVNGDGTPDVYVVQAGNAAGNIDDVMLLNATVGTAVDFVAMSIPQVTAGVGQSAFPIDYDGNGLTDFLVLNGQGQAGPLELVAFFPTPAGRPMTEPAATPSGPASSAELRTTPHPAATACGPSFAAEAYPVDGSGTPRINALLGTEAGAWGVGSAGGATAVADRWDGSAWSSVHLPPLQGGSSGLEALAGGRPDDVWSVGYEMGRNEFQTAAMHWDGTAWSVVPTPDPGPDGDSLLGVSAVSSTDVWAVGYQTTANVEAPLVERWDGAAWNLTDVATGSWDAAKLAGVLALGPADVWAAGWTMSGGVFSALLEHWDGVAWTIVPGPPIPGVDSSLLTSIASDRAGGAWAVGYTSTGSRDQTLVEHYDGTQWSLVPSADPGTHSDVFRAVASVSLNDAWAVGMTLDSDGRFLPLIEHWDGMSWHVFDGPALGLGDNPVQAVASFSRSSVWTGGEGPKMEHLCPVLVRDGGFSTTVATATQGQSVLWQIQSGDASSHSVTDGTGLGLFDSGPLPPGATYQAEYVAAGTYLVQDTVGAHTSRIQVPLRVSPPTAPLGTTFSIVWASASAPTGMVYDVQVKVPGSSEWISLYRGTEPNATYAPVAVGTYTFRSRLGNPSLGVFSGFCPAKSITVT
jgi:hypothetical protein